MFETHKNQILSIFPWPSELGQIYDSCEIVRYVQPRLVEGEKLSNVHIVQWIECSQMLTKILQVVEKKLSVRHIQLPTILPLKEIFEAICPKRWRGQVSEQEVSHAGQPRPPVNGLLRFTYAFLFFFKILLKVQFTSTHCNAFIPFLFIHLSL